MPPTVTQGDDLPPAATLTIGELARRTGVNVATLRMWEERHGFPVSVRLRSGHRRYVDDTVEKVLRVQRRREAGVRLDAAVAEVASDPSTAPSSIFAELRRRRPDLVPRVLRKRTLLALTRALEDECLARAQEPWLIASFQHERHYRSALPRWRELDRTAQRSWVLAAFDHPSPSSRPVEVDVPPSAALLREWDLICVAPDFPAALLAWELPGQVDVRDSDRRFESVWTLEAPAVVDAARAGAGILADLGQDVSGLTDELDRWTGTSQDLAQATTLFHRMLAYVDESG
jgi:MerR family transcriptional regulator, light-induced transcriptional regulator